MRKKMKNQKGETLVEALLSLVIVLLSMGILTTAVLVAGNINKENRERDEAYAQQLYNAEAMAVPMPDTNVKLHVQFHEGLADKSDDLDIVLYGGEENDFVSYEEKETE